MEVSVMVSFLSRHKIVCVILILITLIGISIAIILTSTYALIGKDWTEINCDVKLIRLSTTIDIYKDNEKLGFIKGNIIRFLTDPLTYYNADGNKIAYADDTYHLISQDSHAIIVDDVVTCEMVGRVKLLGEKYDIYNTDGDLIAHADFDFMNLYGKIVDKNEKPIVVYKANPILKDYSIYISPDCTIDENTIIMICSSYYSDRSADSKNSNTSN